MSALAELVEATNALAGLLEATGEYYYEDVTVKRWVLGPGGKSGNCDECIENADEGEIEESEFFPADSGLGPVDEPPLHPNCFLAGTLVTAGSVSAQMKRWYEGEIVTLGCSGIDKLSCTPNHPILTRRGWLAAGLLQTGDDLVQCFLPRKAAVIIDPRNHYIETDIEQISRSPLMAGGMRLRGVPISAEAFHGDASIHSKVDIVGAAGALLCHGSEIRDRDQFAEKGIFAGSHRKRLALSMDRTLAHILNTSDHSADGIMGGIGAASALNRRHLGVHVQAGLASGTLPEPHSAPSFSDCFSGDFDALRNREYALAGTMRFIQLLEVERSNFAGHVFNLETVDGFYLAHTIVAHNCTCGIEYRDTRRRVYV